MSISRNIVVTPIDLHFMHHASAIGAYIIRHAAGAALVETGPGSTKDRLVSALSEMDLDPEDVTHVFITHIHLDHAGASGWLARHGAEIHVHPFGAPHMLDPEKLLTSAGRLYGERMDTLWGEFLSVPPDRLIAVQDGEVVKVGELEFKAIHTPGHAEHHITWVMDDFCFSGDAGGVRLPGSAFISMPYVPPELHIDKWRLSLQKLLQAGFKNIVPTHFGIFNDAASHLEQALDLLGETEQWLEQVMVMDPDLETLRERFVSWQHSKAEQMGMDSALAEAYELANPTWMGADGLMRYWRKLHPSGSSA